MSICFKWIEKERDKVKDEIAADLATIKSEADRQDRAKFIKFIYEKYPPKNKKVVCPNIDEDMSNDSYKKVFKKALIHYHPDKNLSDDYGFAWYFTVVEIARHLGAFYERLK